MGEIDVERLLNFLGYGNPTADVVFIGMEEVLSASPPLREQLQARSKFDRLMDLRISADAHADRFFRGTSPPIQPTWNLMMRILIARAESKSAEPHELKRYQLERLGTRNGESAMLEFMPLPAQNRSSWPYKDIPELAKRFPTRESYEFEMSDFRAKLLREHLNYGPKLVLCYGATLWSECLKLFPTIDDWSTKGVFRLGTLQQTRVILAPHFISRQMNGQRENLIGLCMESNSFDVARGHADISSGTQ